MSITTTSEEYIDRAKQELASAIRALSQVVVYECGGYDELGEHYRNNVKEVFYSLIDLRDKL